MPVLDGNMDADGLSDARSLAASMRGGGDEPEDREVAGAFSPIKKQQPEVIVQTPQDSVSVNSMESNISTLCQTDALLSVLAEDLLPVRPHRIEPRNQKRRRKAYPVMVKPRAELRARMLHPKHTKTLSP